MNLSQFCPSKIMQYKATCYAYAVVYTAMSSEFNIIHNITDRNKIEADYFSSGVVASRNNSNLRLKKRSLRCGKYGTAEKALTILKNTGTVFSNDFDCNCMKYSKILRKIGSNVNWYKISDFETLTINNKYSLESVNWIKSALANRHPVIISILQNSILLGNRNQSLDEFSLDSTTLNRINRYRNGTANHVVCILGYDDQYKNNQGYFLVKNNFKGWGNGQGFSWIPYVYLLPLIRKAHYIKGIVRNE